uniref:Uncharacterized protein n=1 Tax=Dunaliella tertiolecta TaxID=3047 RepID=A0A7S3QXN3_DUNTE
MHDFWDVMLTTLAVNVCTFGMSHLQRLQSMFAIKHSIVVCSEGMAQGIMLCLTCQSCGAVSNKQCKSKLVVLCSSPHDPSSLPACLSKLTVNSSVQRTSLHPMLSFDVLVYQAVILALREWYQPGAMGSGK